MPQKFALFADPFHNEVGSWPLGYIPYGGADFGEVAAVAAAVGTGDDSAFYEAWVAAADRFNDQANESLAKGRRASARELFLRATCFYAASQHPIYGKPVDPRLVAAFRKQTVALKQALALSDPPIEPLSIPFEKTPLPAYFIPAEKHPSEVQPLVIFTNGYDGSLTDMYFACAMGASRRGYHSLIFDGPGQGALLIEHGIPLRHDWETVVKAVVDFAVTLPLVDPARIALSGWSLGGYLSPRAASGEYRLRACIADPGQWGLAWGFRKYVLKMGASPNAAANLGELDQALLDRMWEVVIKDRRLRWSIVQRGFWVNGVDNLRDYFRSAELFTMEGRAELIRCPTLLTTAENDPLSRKAHDFLNALRCPKTLIEFKASEGAGNHCEMSNRSLLHRRVFDWLDEIMLG